MRCDENLRVRGAYGVVAAGVIARWPNLRFSTRETRCGQCQGTGVMKSTRGHMVFSRPCGHCAGAGHQSHTQCARCKGQQGQMRTAPLTLTMPPGIADGARLRVPGKGHAGRNGGEAGDLFVTVSVALPLICADTFQPRVLFPPLSPQLKEELAWTSITPLQKKTPLSPVSRLPPFSGRQPGVT